MESIICLFRHNKRMKLGNFEDYEQFVSRKSLQKKRKNKILNHSSAKSTPEGDIQVRVSKDCI